MPVLKLYHHGTTAGMGHGSPSRKRGKRSTVTGWSYNAVRRNTRFLYSVREGDLSGDGFAVTLTLKQCPPSHDAWHALRRSYVERLRRMGMIRLHWVTEWQRRGVPHLHFAVWFPASPSSSTYVKRLQGLVGHWLQAGASRYGAKEHGQHVVRIESAIGWFQYVAKHASRGAGHYQRSDYAIPKQWAKTGRMWGHIGNWPNDDAMRIEIDKRGFFAFRRIVRNMRVADARGDFSPSRVRQARQMLKSPHRASCEVRGVSEWVSLDAQLQIVAFLAGQGFHVDQIG